MRVVERAVSPDDAARIANAVRRLHLERRAPLPHELEAGSTSFMFYEASWTPHRFCLFLPCGPLCELARSLPAKASVAGLCDKLRVRAFVRGSHATEHSERIAIEWTSAAPTSLTVVAPREPREVALVDSHEPLFVVTAHMVR